MLAILSYENAEDVLTPDQVIERLQEEFERVNVDANKGRASCERELKLLRSLNAPAPIIAMTERGVANAKWVTVTEGGLSFEFLLTDEGNIRISHEDEHEDLIRRCADVLKAHVEGCG
jgi:hypothetical protein